MRFALFTILLLACDHDHDGYASYQQCFDEHVGAEALPINQAIVVCCLDHPIHEVMTVCGNTAAECTAYLGANLASTSATQAEVSAACTEYITQKGM